MSQAPKILYLKQSVDTRLDYQLPGGKKTRYHLEIFLHEAYAVVIFRESFPPDGTSIENAINDLMVQVLHNYHLDPARTVWFEHHLEEVYAGEWPYWHQAGWEDSYRRVEVQWRGSKPDHLVWRRWSPRAVDILVGRQPLPSGFSN